MQQATMQPLDGGCAFGTLGGIIVTVLRTPSTVERLRLLRTHLTRQFARYKPDQIGSIVVLEHSAFAQPPPDEVRRAQEALTREFQSRGAAIVLEGSGFRAVAARAMMSGLYLVVRPAYPHKICSSADEGARWLMSQFAADSGAPAPAEILAVVEQAR